jgi:hypothetical protein
MLISQKRRSRTPITATADLTFGFDSYTPGLEKTYRFLGNFFLGVNIGFFRFFLGFNVGSLNFKD